MSEPWRGRGSVEHEGSWGREGPGRAWMSRAYKRLTRDVPANCPNRHAQRPRTAALDAIGSMPPPPPLCHGPLCGCSLAYRMRSPERFSPSAPSLPACLALLLSFRACAHWPTHPRSRVRLCSLWLATLT